MKYLIHCLLLAVIVAQASCRRGNDRQAVFPVQGQVLYQGQPAAGARVSLVPIDQKTNLRPQGAVGDGGSFELSTYELNDGAPTGRYAVVITWPGPNPRSNGKGDDELEGPDRLGGRYSDPTASAWHVEVGTEPVELEPFQLH